MISAADGVRLHVEHRPPAPGGAAQDGLVLVLLHGFTGSAQTPGMRRAADVLSRDGAVVLLDQRGHGRSEGLSTLGDREVLDLTAAVDWARGLGFTTVVPVGFSMGGSVVVRHAGLVGGVDAAVSVSAPSRWFYQGTAAMRRLHRVVGSEAGRRAARMARGVRVSSQEWVRPYPPEPREAAAQVTVPLLVVHGDRDHYFPLDHGRQLAAAAGEHGTLWVEPGFGHAEAAADDRLLGRIGAWVRDVVG